MATFELIDPVPGAPAPPGPWITRPDPPVAFGMRTEPREDALIWRVNLPSDPGLAQAALSTAGQGLRNQVVALDSATARIQQIAYGGTSFGVGQMPNPERELVGLIGEFDPTPTAARSFGLRESAQSNWDEAEERFRAFSNQVHTALTTFAIVETNIAAVMVGRSSVGWSGGVRSFLRSDINPEDALLHRKSLALAIESRSTLFRTFSVVLKGAAIVAKMISSPVGTVTALPAAWKFVDELLTEIRATAA